MSAAPAAWRGHPETESPVPSAANDNRRRLDWSLRLLHAVLSFMAVAAFGLTVVTFALAHG